jgi:hypothetical protein
MVRLTNALTVRFTEEEYDAIELHATAEGKSAREWSRDRLLAAVESPATRVSVGDVMAEVKAQSGLLGELVVESMLHMYPEDQDKAYGKARELFERVRKGGT